LPGVAITLSGGQAKPLVGFNVVLRHAPAAEVTDAQINLSPRMALIGRQTKPAQALGVVLGHAGALMVADAQGVFVVQVKENQPHLLDIIDDHIQIGKPIECIKTYDKAHGRIEERVGKIYEVSKGCFEDKWAEIGFEKIVVIERRFTKIKTQKVSKETCFYLSNSIKHTNSQLFNAVREHWGIESTHWIRDKTFGEDAIRCANEQRSKNLACLLSVALNLTKQNKTLNIKALHEELSADPDKIIPFFRHFHPI
jgi:predicted transposase YbfD/YdcC